MGLLQAKKRSLGLLQAKKRGLRSLQAKKRGLRSLRSKGLYHLRKRSLFFKGLSSKFSIGFFSFESTAGISNHSSSVYDFSLASPFLQLLSDKRLRYRHNGYENFLSRLLLYRVFHLKRKRFSLGLRGVRKTSRLFLEYRRFKRLTRKSPRLLRWHLYNVNF